MMSTWNYIAIIVVLYFIGYALFWLIGLAKETASGIENRIKARKNTPAKNQPQTPPVVAKSDAEIFNDPNLRDLLERFRPHYRWMTLAGGTDPWLRPQISFGPDGLITLTKQGYDLWDANLKEYYSGTTWEEREKALDRFAKELFGEYTEEMRQIISFEYIADHLIKLEERTCSSSDFYLTYSGHGHLKTARERDLFIHELQSMKIINIEN